MTPQISDLGINYWRLWNFAYHKSGGLGCFARYPLNPQSLCGMGSLCSRMDFSVFKGDAEAVAASDGKKRARTVKGEPW